MEKSEWLSQFDPTAEITAGQLVPFPQDLTVTDGALIASLSDSTEEDLGNFSAISGIEVSSLNIINQGILEGELLTLGENIIGVVREDKTINVQHEGTGVYIGYEQDEEVVSFLLPPNPELAEDDLATITTATGVTFESPNVYNATYRISKILTRTTLNTTDGFLWAAGSILANRYFDVKFATPTIVVGFTIVNFRSDYAVRTGQVEVRDPEGQWYVIHSFDLTASLLAPAVIEFETPWVGSEFRLRATDTANVGGVGRFDLMIKDSVVAGSLKHKPLVFDSSKFDIVETEDELQLSIKPPSGGGEGDELLSPLLYANYSRFTAVLKAGRVMNATLTGVTRIIPVENVLVNNLQLKFKAPAFVLTPGTYKVDVTQLASNTAMQLMYLVDLRNGCPVSSVFSIIGAGTTAMSNSVTYSVNVSVVEPIPVTLGMTNTSPGTMYTTQFTGRDSIIATVDVWKVNDTPVIEYIFPNPNQPVGPGESLPIQLIVTNLLDSGDGRGLIDKLLENLWSGINGVYLNSATHYIIVKIDHDFRLWRVGNTSYPSYISPFKIYRLGVTPVDYSKKTVPIVGAASDWVRFTDALPPGIYKFEGSGLRIDIEWCAEKMPLGSAEVIGPDNRIALIKPMTATISQGQRAIVSSNYNATYVDWKAFNGVLTLTGDSGWASVAKAIPAAPQWVGIEFKVPKTINAYTFWNRALAGYIQSPNSWSLQGRNVGGSWETLHTVANDTNNVQFSERSFVLDQNYTYEHFRLYITDTNGNEGAYTVVEEIQLYFIPDLY